MEVQLRTNERYYHLDGTVFRVRLDRLAQGSAYLKGGRWVWTPITSGSVIDNPNARLLSPREAEEYRALE